MQVWLRGKLDHITQEFLEGCGTGAVFEAQYLAYLECAVADRQGSEVAGRVWDEWTEVCSRATPDGEPVRCLSSRVLDREELVAALRRFQGRFDGPVQRVRVPRDRAKTPKRSSQDEGIDLFALLAGED